MGGFGGGFGGGFDGGLFRLGYFQGCLSQLNRGPPSLVVALLQYIYLPRYYYGALQRAVELRKIGWGYRGDGWIFKVIST